MDDAADVRDRGSAERVTTARWLAADGVQRPERTAELEAGRWRREGLAIVQHNGPLSRRQRHKVALVHAGPRALLTAFTATELQGLRGWDRAASFILGPAGTTVRAACPVPIRLLLYSRAPRTLIGRRVEALPQAALRAAGTLAEPRPGCGLLAAVVQQRLATADQLMLALDDFPRLRHRRLLRAAIADIAGGSQALSEIDFLRLCRRHGLPEPERQHFRPDADGRRRWLDVTWRRRDGKLVVAEVDGGLHLLVRQWWNDQMRQNEIVLGDALVLRYPSVFVRTEEATVVSQLRRALLLTG